MKQEVCKECGKKHRRCYHCGDTFEHRYIIPRGAEDMYATKYLNGRLQEDRHFWHDECYIDIDDDYDDDDFGVYDASDFER